MGIAELQRWFKDHVTIDGKPYPLDEEQAAIVLDGHKNTLVTARAGSGKTHTLIAKIVYLIVAKNVNPSHILALGFYREPQTDFARRLQSIRVDGQPIPNAKQIARTFHSLAYQVVGQQGAILMDNANEHSFAQTEYIDAIVKRIVKGRKIYDFFRDDSYEPRRENYKTEEDYKLALKYTRYDTLNGEKVKSRGEKIIADYLFEHDIDYTYEKVHFFPSKLAQYAIDEESAEKLKTKDKITPDFFLTKTKTLWEHWGIRGDETEEEVARINQLGIIGSYQEYFDNMQFKEWFYGKEWLDKEKIETKEAKDDEYLQKFLSFDSFISTNYQKTDSREDFESSIESLLSSKSIQATKLPESELLTKFKSNKVNSSLASERVGHFIQRAEQQFPNDLETLRQECSKEPEKQTRLFYDMALSAYEYYINDLTADPRGTERELIREMFPQTPYVTDHSININNAAKLIASNSESFRCSIKFDELEYIFLDEYQDFSLLFLNLVQSMCKRNPNIRILAMGDDWQAISGFAGASLEYFYGFENYFSEDVAHLRISINRRSVASIVEAANRFMLNAFNDNMGAVAIKEDKDTQALNNCSLDAIHNFSKAHDEDYSNGYKKYGLLLSEIIKDNAGKSIRFLSRTNDLKFEDNETRNISKYQNEFAALYRDKIKGVDLENDICFATVNSSKGLQADVIVILESDTGRFPIFHPDNHLYKVFGETEQAALDEQKRLFYVALTRAKERIYIIHKKDMTPVEQKERDFLSMLGIERFQKYLKDSFLSIEAKIKKGYTVIFDAIKVVLSPNRYHPENMDITSIASNGDKVHQYNAFPNGASVQQLKEYVSRCSLEHPMKIKGKPSKAYGTNRYVNLYDPDVLYY